jgi:hypothetical protein
MAAITTPDPQFLAPPTAREEKAPPRASDRGEAAMDRLRHPFAALAEQDSPGEDPAHLS